MTLPAAYDPISLGQIQGEFGGNNPIYLSEYYRTPNGATTGNNTNVPTSGIIALSNFYSAYYAVAVQMNYSREAANQNYFYLSADGFPTIVITTPYNTNSSSITSWIPPNVTFRITANVSNIRRPVYEEPVYCLDDEGNLVYDGEGYLSVCGYNYYYSNGMQLEDSTDDDYNDLEWYPTAGTVYESGGNFYYILN